LASEAADHREPGGDVLEADLRGVWRGEIDEAQRPAAVEFLPEVVLDAPLV